MSAMLRTRLVLAVQDLAVSTRYWTEVLGFTVDPIDGTGWSFLTRDAFSVMLGECRDAPAAATLGDHSYVMHVIMDDVDAYHREIVARGALINSAPQDKPWGLREFGLRTPDGHRITCGQPLTG